MELITLDSDFQPDKVIENFSSLIWTERYSKYGDFQITSTDINTLINLAPKETCISLRDSSVPMIVEDHKIEKKPNSAPLLTVTGRSFETVLERRASVNALASGTVRVPWSINAAKASDAAYEVVRKVIGDFPRYLAGHQVLATISPVDANDAIPEIDLTIPADYQVTTWSSTPKYEIGESVVYSGNVYVAILASTNKIPSSEPTYWTSLGSSTGLTAVASELFEIKPQNLYTTVMELVTTNYRGLKAVRPVIGDTQVGIEIYNGADLTSEVVFDARFDQFDSSAYLLSQRGSTNVGYVYGSNGATKVLKTTAPEPSGLERRVLVVDDSNDDTINTADIRKSRGLIELYQYNATALFDGEVSQQVATGYNTDYFLGDILQFIGEYGLTENVRVVEFIRTSDATGEKAYPAFEAVV